MAEALLELADIRKTYPAVIALDHVTLKVGRGEVLGLIGENVAGKSTLMKILDGVTAPSSGRIRLAGREFPSLSVPDAIAGGIAFVHQELNLFTNLTVAANILIGREPLYGGPLKLVDGRAMRRRVAPILARLGADFDADAMVSELSLAQMQLVEVAKALSLDARLVIMDEPTSSLTLSETEKLLRVIGDLKSSGVSVIFISHRLNEVRRCADRVAVLRDGRLVGELEGDDIKPAAMIRLMIGRDLKSLYVPPARPRDRVVLALDHVQTRTHPQRRVSLDLHGGEILGLAGLVGSGRTELARAVFGVDTLLGGTVRLMGESIVIRSPRDAIGRGIYLVPEDRKRSSLLLDMSVAENISLPELRKYAQGFLVHPPSEAANAERQRRVLNIKTPDVTTPVASLSGGNQQKVVLAKWLSMQPRAIIFDEPTRGIDVGAKNEIYALMRRLADSGVAIMMISSDMEEVIGVSDRIAVMHEGAISGFLERERFSETNVLQLAVGHLH